MKRNKMKVIGLTGGVGAGKSTILKMIQEMTSCVIIEADKVGHRLMEPQEVNYKAIVAAYGPSVVLENGQIDKKALAKMAFSTKEGTEQLNALTHPNILKAITQTIEQAQQDGVKCVVLEAAILHQGGLIGLCDEVWYVHVPKDIRKQRIMETRGYDEARAEAVMSRQPSNEQYRAMSTKEIQNHASLEEVRKQVLQLILDER